MDLFPRLYAVGGRDGSSCLRSVECFDPHTNRSDSRLAVTAVNFLCRLYFLSVIASENKPPSTGVVCVLMHHKPWIFESTVYMHLEKQCMHLEFFFSRFIKFYFVRMLFQSKSFSFCCCCCLFSWWTLPTGGTAVLPWLKGVEVWVWPRGTVSCTPSEVTMLQLHLWRLGWATVWKGKARVFNLHVSWCYFPLK